MARGPRGTGSAKQDFATAEPIGGGWRVTNALWRNGTGGGADGYYGPNGFYELKGSVAPAYVAPQARDEGSARKLWEVSEKLTGVEWPSAERSEISSRRHTQ